MPDVYDGRIVRTYIIGQYASDGVMICRHRCFCEGGVSDMWNRNRSIIQEECTVVTITFGKNSLLYTVDQLDSL